MWKKPDRMKFVRNSTGGGHSKHFNNVNLKLTLAGFLQTTKNLKKPRIKPGNKIQKSPNIPGLFDSWPFEGFIDESHKVFSRFSCPFRGLRTYPFCFPVCRFKKP